VANHEQLAIESTDPDHGELLMLLDTPRMHRSNGCETAACSSPSASSRQPEMRSATAQSQMIPREQHGIGQTGSDNQRADHRELVSDFGDVAVFLDEGIAEGPFKAGLRA
jgi:hypothetical protein